MPPPYSSVLDGTRAKYMIGDRVEFRPIGGATYSVSHSTGLVTNIANVGGEERYIIKDDNTGKEGTYLAMNIVGKV